MSGIGGVPIPVWLTTPQGIAHAEESGFLAELVETERLYANMCRLIAMLHRHGVSARTLAEKFRVSKSTFARHLPFYLAVAEAAESVPRGTAPRRRAGRGGDPGAGGVPRGTAGRAEEVA